MNPNRFVRTDPSLVHIDTVFKPAPKRADSSSRSAAVTDLTGDDLELGEMCECLEPLLDTGVLGSSGDPNVPFSFLLKKSAGGTCLNCGKRAPSLQPGSQASYGADFNDLDDFGNSFGGSSQATQATQATTRHTCSTAPVVDTGCDYDSVRAMLGDVHSALSRDEALRKVIKTHTFVGVLNSVHSIVQFGTKLLLVHHAMLCQVRFICIIHMHFYSALSFLLSDIDIDTPITTISPTTGAVLPAVCAALWRDACYACGPARRRGRLHTGGAGGGGGRGRR